MVIPNAATVEFLRPRSTDRSDGRTIVFFGLMS